VRKEEITLLVLASCTIIMHMCDLVPAANGIAMGLAKVHYKNMMWQAVSVIIILTILLARALQLPFVSSPSLLLLPLVV
jgi:hypothetical protein